MRELIAVVLLSALSLCAERTTPAVFYVDDQKGSDLAAGTSPNAAWQTLIQVNRAEIIPGDKVLLRCGGLWRGQLRPRSGIEGKRVLYSSYGKGRKPTIQGSLSYSTKDCWRESSSGIWSTVVPTVKLHKILKELRSSEWQISYQEKAKGTFNKITEGTESFYRIKCQHTGGRSNWIQLWGPKIESVAEVLQFKVRMRSTMPFSVKGMESMLSHSPWTRAYQGHAPENTIGKEWQELTFNLQKQNGIMQSALHFSLGGIIPSGAQVDIQPLSIYEAGYTAGRPIPCDVGILIMDHGKAWGVKKWKLDQLTKPLDYWYDPAAFQLHVKMDKNPAQLYKSVELALKKHIVDENGCHDITYDGIAIRYGAAHGFGGSNTENITIRNCDISWIGGALQMMHARGFPVRYGNGIEFWNSAKNNLVENNRIWEIYDAALTNQGKGGGKNVSDHVNITYRNNTIWNAEYSFEYWNRPETAITRNVIFEHNTCIDAGCGWAHNQRPDRNGGHLMFYKNAAKTENLVVRNNIFVNSTEVITRMENDWRSGLVMHNNLLFQSEKPIMRWLIKNYYSKDDFKKYQEELKVDQNSMFAKPDFVNPDQGDYTLKPGSAGEKLATDGGCVGVR
ncbi:MAG: right-handed parallel beta-helix repeat-containing protein [Kiritimatiellae bacterium]|jgi:hypothetical protein|nr:right-handed parallel beta-helix repeat-containing protein [Kiritimatiellia bacterium]